MLKKEEDDLKDAILYFHPEEVRHVCLIEFQQNIVCYILFISEFHCIITV